jgi:hypothetical protein
VQSQATEITAGCSAEGAACCLPEMHTLLPR